MQPLIGENKDTFQFRVCNVDLLRIYKYLMENPEEIGKGDEATVQRWKERLQYEGEYLGFFNLPDRSGSTL